MHSYQTFFPFIARVFGCLCLMLGVAASYAAAQQVTVSVSSGSSAPGGAVTLNVSVASVGAASTSLEWTMNYPSSSITNVSVATGSAATAMGKSVTCGNSMGATTCIVFGVNQTTIADGVLAAATFNISAGATSSVPVQITNVIASTAAGQSISASGTGGTISVGAAAPSLSGISCSPATLGTAQTATCTATLTQPSASATTVALSSSTTLLNTPVSLAIPAAASGGTVTVAAGAIVTSQTAALTATLNGQSVSTPVNLTAAVSLSGLSCSPSTVNTPGTAACVVTLSGPAKGSGVVVAVTSNNANAALPATVTVPAGSSTFSITATIAAVSTAQTATVTAAAGGASQTFVLKMAPALWSISGAITPLSLGSGATVTLNGGQTASADSSGNYTFAGLANGTYTLAPSKSGYSFTPPNQSVTVNGKNVSAANFTAIPVAAYGTITMDAQVRQDQAKANFSVTSPLFSTAAGNELLLAFIAAGYRYGHTRTAVNSVSGGGLTWVLVSRTQAQRGTAEIWRAFSPVALSGVSVSASLTQGVTSSLTVMSFAGVDSSGVNGSGAIGAIGQGNGSSGSPTASLTTTRNNSLVYGVGEDPSGAIARTAGAGQTLVHQDLALSSDTYWVQTLNNAVPLSGTSVTINDSSPTADPYNLALVEILAAPLSQTQLTGAIGNASLMKSSMMAAASSTPAAANSDSSPILSNLRGGEVIHACSPGGLAALLGSGMTTEAPQAAAGFPLPVQLAGLQVMVSGNPVPILFASDSEVKFQCPMLAPGTPLDIVVEGPGNLMQSAAASVMESASPELFSLGAGGQGVVLLGATSELAMLNGQASASRPARAGDSLTIYASGLGVFNGTLAAGTPAPAGSAIPLQNQVRVVVGGTEIDPVSAGLAPGTVGLSQVDFALPPGLSPGPAVPLYLKVMLPNGAVVESNEVTIAIQ
jgi:uncharacterized protein (TIGR03437 family)